MRCEKCGHEIFATGRPTVCMKCVMDARKTKK